MVYTISDGLRDREFDKFKSPVQGSVTAVATSAHDRIQTYTFPLGSLTASTGKGVEGFFSSYTDEYLDGDLKAIVIQHSNWDATGSLYLFTSGYGGIEVWHLKSGTVTCNTAESGAYIIKASARTTDNTNLSGTNSPGMMADIPLYGYFQLVGSGLGFATHCSGLTIVYG